MPSLVLPNPYVLAPLTNVSAASPKGGALADVTTAAVPSHYNLSSNNTPMVAPHQPLLWLLFGTFLTNLLDPGQPGELQLTDDHLDSAHLAARSIYRIQV